MVSRTWLEVEGAGGYDFAQRPVQRFHAVGDVDRLANVQGVIEKGCDARPVPPPHLADAGIDILSLVERPSLLKATPEWILEPGRPAEMTLPSN